MVKHTKFVGKLPTNCLSVFDHSVGLALKGLISFYNGKKCHNHPYPAGNYMFKVNNRNTRMFKVNTRHQNDANGVTQVSLLLPLNIFQTFFLCSYY